MSSAKPTPPTTRTGFVALIGPTNAGKSTLLNAFLGQKVAITTPKPQTTRNRILGVNTLGERGQIIFVDTPGLHRAVGELGERMNALAVRSIADSDLALLVVDVCCDVAARGPLAAVNGRALEKLTTSAGAAAAGQRRANAGQPKWVIALNQVDRVGDKASLLPTMAAYAEAGGGAEIVPVSALTGDGLDRLEAVLLAKLPEGPFLYPADTVSDQAEHFLAAEIIREKVTLLTHQELPYSVAIEIEQWEDPKTADEALHLAAVIHVERKSQKGIVIGKAGGRLKAIGTSAREDLERAFDVRVFLELFVRIEKDWSKDPRRLDRFGYR